MSHLTVMFSLEPSKSAHVTCLCTASCWLDWLDAAAPASLGWYIGSVNSLIRSANCRPAVLEPLKQWKNCNIAVRAEPCNKGDFICNNKFEIVKRHHQHVQYRMQNWAQQPFPLFSPIYDCYSQYYDLWYSASNIHLILHAMCIKLTALILHNKWKTLELFPRLVMQEPTACS